MLLLAAAISFTIGGIAIPIYAPALILEPGFSRRDKIISALFLTIWAIALSYSVVKVLELIN
jgi:hypothetical protein